MAWRQHLDFHPVAFVREDSTRNSSETSQRHSRHSKTTSKAEDGKDIHEFYKELVGLDGTDVKSEASQIPVKLSPQKSAKRKRKHKELQPKQVETKTIDSGAFLGAAQTSNLKILEAGLKNGIDIDTVDQYGWTALMCAAQSGHSEVVQFLVRRGANINIRDKRGMTASDIAVKSKKPDLVQVMMKKESCTDASTSGVRSSKRTKRLESYNCDICKGQFSASETTHKASTVHLFNMKFETKSTSYQIQPSNQGYKMMRRSGWKEERGLGPEGSGQKYPVKTILKRDRVGLGSKNAPKAKVTHFDPHDKSAIKHIRHRDRTERDLSTVTKKESQLQAKRARRKEIKFRREFYGM